MKSRKGNLNPNCTGKNATNYLGVTKICQSCNKEYTPKEIRKNRPQKFCSRRCSKLGQNNPQWKETPGYSSLHFWGNRNKKKASCCEKCGEDKKLDLANISGKYKRDTDDYIWLCRKCHMEYDGVSDRLALFGKKSRKYTNIPCKNCGVMFLQKFKENKFCGKPCSTIYYNKNIRIYKKNQ